MKDSGSVSPAFLVTGASGFIGRHLVVELRERFPDAVLLVQHRPGTSLPTGPATISVPAALGDLDSAARGLVPRLTGAFHLASYTPKEAGREDEDAVIEANVLGLRSVLRFLEGKVDALVFTSTLDVYGTPEDGEVITERSPLRPATAYAASKLMGELMVRSWGKRTGGRTAVVRVGHVYGPGESAYRKLIPNVIRRVLDGKAPVLMGTGAESRDYLYVRDAAAGLVAAWSALASGDVGPVNLVSGTPVTVADVVRLVCEESGCALPTEHVAPAVSPRSLRFDATNMLRDLGIRPATSLRDGLRREIAWFRDQAG